MTPIITDENFYCQHLFDSETNFSAIQDFFVSQPTGKGLELYLKNSAPSEEGLRFCKNVHCKIENDRRNRSVFHAEVWIVHRKRNGGLFSHDFSR